MDEERRMITDDEAEVVCTGIFDYLCSLDREPEVPASDIFGQMLFLFARKYGYIDSLSSRQVTNLTDADKKKIESIWESDNF